MVQVVATVRRLSGQAVLATFEAVQPALKRAVEGGIAVSTFVLSVHMYLWAARMIEITKPEHLASLSASLGAVLGPLSLLQGYVLAKYLETRPQ